MPATLTRDEKSSAISKARDAEREAGRLVRKLKEIGAAGALIATAEAASVRLQVVTTELHKLPATE